MMSLLYCWLISTSFILFLTAIDTVDAESMFSRR